MRRTAASTLAISFILSLAVAGYGGPCQQKECCGACAVAESSAEPVKLDDESLAIVVRQFEDEGMAKELYLAFHEKWGLRPFHNIATRGETHHAAAVRGMLEAAGVEVAETKAAEGKYTDPESQKFRDRLMEQGMESLEGAILAGLEFEEHDIKTLREDAASCTSEHVVGLLKMLETGSRNHLRAFHRHAEMRGIAYEPKHLSKSEFAAALGLNAEDAPEADQPDEADSEENVTQDDRAASPGRGQGRQGRVRARRGR